MCATCGCDDAAIAPPAGEHTHGPVDRHSHEPSGGRTVEIQRKVLARNDELAAANRRWLHQRGVVAVNLMSAPGSGKTTLLERTVAAADGLVIGVIEGDQETTLDADRIRSAGCRVVQVNTGAGCHLDAAMVARAVRALDPPRGSVVVIENVGNLVCPALFDLGEAGRVVLVSVTEGADKPAKYPGMFRAADLVLLTKTDLLPHVAFDAARFDAAVRRTAPHATTLRVSAVTGDGMAAWCDWLRTRVTAASVGPQ